MPASPYSSQPPGLGQPGGARQPGRVGQPGGAGQPSASAQVATVQSAESGARSYVRPITVQDAALRQLRRFLLEGQLRPGDWIRVDRIAALLDVSAVPVREALQALIGEGRVEYAPHRGYRVTRLSVEDVEEIFLICSLLEAEAIRRGVPGLSDPEIIRMEDLLGDIQQVPSGQDLWETVRLHQEFHFVPVMQARLPRLEAELRRLWDHTDHYRGLYIFTDPGSSARMAAEHRSIALACRARDAEEVVRLMEAHRDHAVEALRLKLDKGTAEQPEAAEGGR